jgi:hypothetical protein
MEAWLDYSRSRESDNIVEAFAFGGGCENRWPVVSGMPNRAAGCRLVGNAIVPAVAWAIFAAIDQIEGAA